MTCDTLYVSFDAALPGWLVGVLRASQVTKNERVGLARNGNPLDPLPYDPREPMSWLCSHGAYEGDPTVEWTVIGTDVWEGVRLGIGRPVQAPDGAGWTYRVKVMLSSALLWSYAGRGMGAYEAASAVLEGLTVQCHDHPAVLLARPEDQAVKVSRLDLCCDHIGYDWEPEDLYRFATRMKTRAAMRSGGVVRPDDDRVWTYTGPTSATYYVGRRGSGNRFWRIYDKTEEARVSGKLPWMSEVWKAHGWDGKAKVWRAEVECRSGWLKDHGVTFAGLRGIERELWRDATRSVRHTCKKGKRLTRARTSKIWAALSRAGGSVLGCWEWKPKPLPHGGTAKALLAQAAGCLRRVESMANGGTLHVPGDASTASPWKSAPSLARSRYEVLQAVQTAQAAKGLPPLDESTLQSVLDVLLTPKGNGS